MKKKDKKDYFFKLAKIDKNSFKINKYWKIVFLAAKYQGIFYFFADIAFKNEKFYSLSI
jgi:hypothetical protein